MGTAGLARRPLRALLPGFGIVAAYKSASEGQIVAQPLRLLVDRIKEPIGELMVAADEMGALRAIDWSDRETGLRRLLRLHYGKDGDSLTPHRDPHGLSAAMGAYFAGSLTAIDGLEVQPAAPISGAMSAGAAGDPLRDDRHLWGAGAAHRPPGRCPGGRSRQRCRSHQHRRAVPSRHRRGQEPHRMAAACATADAWAGPSTRGRAARRPAAAE